MTIFSFASNQPLSVNDGGSNGLPVLFIHSLAGNASQWSAQLTHLRQQRRAIALDLPGHGHSPAPTDGDYTMQAMAAAVAGTVARLDLRRFVLVGHSAGAAVAIAYTEDYPERVAGLLFVDPVGDQRQVPAERVDPFLAALETDQYQPTIEAYWTTILTGSEPSVQARILADLQSTPQASVLGIFRALREYDPVPGLKSYSGPMLSIITPLNDAPFSLHKLIPALPHRLVTGTGHWLQLDKPDEFNQILDEFLAQVDRLARTDNIF